MEGATFTLPPVLSHAEPVLAVQDIVQTVNYWHEVLGFPGKWTWGTPPNHGGVSWQSVFVQFSLQPELAIASAGNSMWIKVDRIEELYAIHLQRKADIVAPIEVQPWGMAQYTVQDINGYYIHFAATTSEERSHTSKSLPERVQIIGRKPTPLEYASLHISADGPAMKIEDAEKRVQAAITGAVAIDTINNEVIGHALILGDNASFYYIKDVVVAPAWQGRRVGSAIMQELTRWLDNNGANHALVALICREGLEPFYKQFGFGNMFGMLRFINREEQ